jgi:hypothetical protein
MDHPVGVCYGAVKVALFEFRNRSHQIVPGICPGMPGFGLIAQLRGKFTGIKDCPVPNATTGKPTQLPNTTARNAILIATRFVTRTRGFVASLSPRLQPQARGQISALETKKDVRFASFRGDPFSQLFVFSKPNQARIFYLALKGFGVYAHPP